MDFLSSILVQKLILYFLLYLFGLLGFGNVYFFFFFFLACVWISIKTCNEAEATKFRPDIWWLEDNLVERVDWLNQILKQFWPNVISCLQLTLDQIPNGEIIKKGNLDLIKCSFLESRMKWIGLKEIKLDREVMLKNLPRIEGAQISSLGDDLSVFLKISYHSDLNVQFVCENSPLSSALKNISFSGLLQIKFRKQVPITDIQVSPIMSSYRGEECCNGRCPLSPAPS